jgi:hypothetical protein
MLENGFSGWKEGTFPEDREKAGKEQKLLCHTAESEYM